MKRKPNQEEATVDIVKTLTIFGYRVSFELPELWRDIKFDKRSKSSGQLSFIGPIRAAGFIEFNTDGNLRVRSGSIRVFILTGGKELLSAEPTNVYPSSIITFHAPPLVKVVVRSPEPGS